MFGGISNIRYNEVFVFDFSNNTWKKQDTNGRQPSARCYHCCFYDVASESIYYHGGQGDKGKSLFDFCVLNTKNFIWRRLFMLEMPPPRYYHIICDFTEKEKLIFGGITTP